MTFERSQSIVEEIAEVSTLAELKALHCFGQSNNNEYGDAQFVADFKAAAVRLKGQPPVQGLAEEKENNVEQTDLEAKVAELMAQVAALKQPKPAVVRGGKRYKLLSLDVAWSTTPQVHSIAAILGAHAKVGDVLDEADIVSMMEANVAVLETRQGGKKIWDYYKSKTIGLQAHGNVEAV